MSSDAERRLQQSWTANAEAWTRAVRGGAIESRRVATDAAVLDVVRALAPRRVLDVGCGEGWLARAVAAEGADVLGIDASAPLIQAARRVAGARFELCSYQELQDDPDRLGGPFDVAVCNFSLLGESMVPMLATLRRLLAEHGHLVVQTVHPWAAAGDEGYRDGWRTERFDRFDEPFAAPMPWYFRTLESWVSDLAKAGFTVSRVREPVHPSSGQPLSLLLTCRPLHQHPPDSGSTDPAACRPAEAPEVKARSAGADTDQR